MWRTVLCGVWFSVLLCGQSTSFRTLEVAGGGTVEFAVVVPAGYDGGAWHPVLLALAPGPVLGPRSGPRDRAAVQFGLKRWWGERAAARGWVVVSPVLPEAPAGAGQAFGDRLEGRMAQLLDHVRTTVRVEGGRIYLAGAGSGGSTAMELAQAWPFEFRALVLPAAAQDRGEGGGGVAAALRAAGVAVEHADLAVGESGPLPQEGDPVIEVLERLRARAQPPAGAVGDLHRVLDDFHDAACKGDEARYFGRFCADAVFLGTDPGERWDLAAFRGYALRYFERPSAWIYVPSRRHVTLGPDGATAWFDEVVTNRSYGDCRGTGVLRRDGEEWLLCQYNLTLPIPNAITRHVVARIRAHGAGGLAQGVTVVAVRHAEKGDGDDPGLTEAGRARAERLAEMLRQLPVQLVLTSPFCRTVATAQPLCDVLGLAPVTLPPMAYDRWRAAIAEVEAGGVVVVVGHSSTVPGLLGAIGVGKVPTLTEADYDRLFVARPGAAADLLELRF